MKNLFLPMLCPLFAGCSSFEAHDCNGTTLLVLRDLNEVYPTFASNFKLELDLALKTKNDIGEITVGGQWEEQTVKLYKELDQLNYHVRTVLVTAYAAYVNNVCSAGTPEQRSSAIAQWERSLSEVMRLSIKVRELNSQIASAKHSSSTTEFEKLFSRKQELLDQAAEANLYQMNQ